jgi:hypothetical protein
VDACAARNKVHEQPTPDIRNSLKIDDTEMRIQSHFLSFVSSQLRLSSQQNNYDDDHQYRPETAAIIMEGRPQIKAAATKKKNENKQ